MAEVALFELPYAGGRYDLWLFSTTRVPEKPVSKRVWISVVLPGIELNGDFNSPTVFPDAYSRTQVKLAAEFSVPGAPVNFGQLGHSHKGRVRFAFGFPSMAMSPAGA